MKCPACGVDDDHAPGGMTCRFMRVVVACRDPECTTCPATRRDLARRSAERTRSSAPTRGTRKRKGASGGTATVESGGLFGRASTPVGGGFGSHTENTETRAGDATWYDQK